MAWQKGSKCVLIEQVKAVYGEFPELKLLIISWRGCLSIGGGPTDRSVATDHHPVVRSYKEKEQHCKGVGVREGFLEEGTWN